MIDINEYIKFSIEERQKHLALQEECIIRGGKAINSSGYLRGLLAHLHNTTMPNGHKIHVCHACNNKYCSNPNHLYWGTASENRFDSARIATKSPWDYIVEKYGLEKAKEIMRNNAKPKLAGMGNKGKSKSEEHKRKISLSIKKSYELKKGKRNV